MSDYRTLLSSFVFSLPSIKPKFGTFDFWLGTQGPTQTRSSDVEQVPLGRYSPLVRPLVRHHFFSKTGHEIILIFCMKLDIDNRKKLTEPFFGQKFWIIQKLQICAKKWGFWHFAENLTME